MSHHINTVRIKGVYNALAELKDSVVFVGRATVSLYADSPDSVDVRPTDDIDVLIEIGTYGAYVQLQDKLFQLGFSIDKTSKVTCRYKYEGLTEDVMPTDEAVLGFTNKWYKEGFDNMEKYRLDERTEVNIFSPPYFIASKLEAFKGRGNGDGRTSQDFEDIVFVLDNRSTIWEELKSTNAELNEYLKRECKKIFENSNIEEWLSAHLEYTTAAQRATTILTGMNNFR